MPRLLDKRIGGLATDGIDAALVNAAPGQLLQVGPDGNSLIVAPGPNSPWQVVNVSGTANAITLTVPGFKSYSQLTGTNNLVFTAALDNTGNTTINVNGLGNINVFQGGVPLSGGEIIAAQPYIVSYNSSVLYLIDSSAGAVNVGLATSPTHAAQLSQVPTLFSTVYDVTASRSASTVWTNSTGKPMFVMISAQATGPNANLEIWINGNKVTQYQVSSSTIVSSVTAIIPSGAYYQLIYESNSYSVNTWVEIY